MKKTPVSRQKPAENTLASEALAMCMELRHKQLLQLGKYFGEAGAEKSSPIPPITRDEPGVGRLEIWPLDPSEEILHRLLRELFEDHWQDLTFGPLIQGAAWEITVRHPPEKIVLLDGYLTVDFGDLHFHLCIGTHRGDPDAPTDPELAQHRRTHRAEFIRRLNRDDTPDLWAIRLFNGKDEQQITILLPNPFLSHDLKFLDLPDWSRLGVWDTLRRKYLGIAADARDRSGQRMIYP